MENELIRKLAGAIEEQTKKAKSKSYDTQATVKRVEGETVWVHIPGGIDETPVSKTIACSAGDTVQVRVTNGRGFIVGNGSAPPTDDTTAIISKEIATEARYTAETALEDAVTAHDAAISATESAATAGRAASVAQAAADAAQETANSKKTVFVTEPTPPYHVGDLWVRFDPDVFDMVDSDGNSLIDDQGDLFEAAILKEAAAYVCMVPKLAGQAFDESDFELATADNGLREWFWHDASGAHVLGDETGFRNDITSTGMKIMDTSTETSVAEFGSNGARIGQSGDTHLEMDYHSLKLVDKEASTYLYISDLRDTNGNITITKEGDGTTTAYLAMFPVSGVSNITIDGVETTSYTYSDGVVTFNTAPSDGSIIAFTYIPDSRYKDGFKAFTLGLRKYNNATPFTYALGYKVNPSNPYAYAEGYMTEAGYMAHAEGVYSKAQGDGSHAGNYYTIAQGAMQTAIGRFNVAQGDPNISHNSDYAFIIGNGTANGARSNAVTVDWSGVIDTANGTVPVFPLFKKISVTHNVTVNANSYATADFAPAAQAGYTRVGVVGWNTASIHVFIATCTNTTIVFGNKSSSSQTCTDAQVDWLFIRSSI